MRQISEREWQKKSKKFYFVYFILILVVIFAASRTASLLKPLAKQRGEARSPVSFNQDRNKREIIIATTTSLHDSGLLDILLPVFERETGFKVKVLAVGSGEALEMGRRQEVDLILAHSPEQEVKFMEEGYGRRREEFMSSDFIIAGPEKDEAGIRGLGLVEAFSRIAGRQALFVSRADNSGTHNLELKIWRLAGINPSGSWYLQTGQGMGESLLMASEKQAYILTDYPTFCRLRSVLKLAVLTRDKDFKNIYSAIVVGGKSSRINLEGAESLMRFLLSPEAQDIIANFRINSSGSDESYPLFRALRLDSGSVERR
ncbi:MAG: substrate-binding domain-containing protein [Candidatus Saccharicenans sp.]|nr:substrate-binding domain-containing protein [Candidatus Saccharicenans sp.]